MFVSGADRPLVSTGAGTTRKLLAFDGSLMMARNEFVAGAIGARHKHPHEQVVYVAAGRFRVQIGDAEAELCAGDSFYVPGDVEHGVKALEAGLLIDVFTPQRADFLK